MATPNTSAKQVIDVDCFSSWAFRFRTPWYLLMGSGGITSAGAVVEVSNDATKVFMDSRLKVRKAICVAVLNQFIKVHQGDDEGL